MASVRALSVTAVKGTRLQRVEEIVLDAEGARGNRRFFVIDERGRMVNGKGIGALQTVVSSCVDDTLTLTFPDGSSVSEQVDGGSTVTCRFFSREREGRLIDGQLAEAISDHVGKPLRLVESPGSVDRGRHGAVSLISQASLSRLASEGELDGIDSRRFRMLFEIDGVAAHEEDRWVGRRFRVGDAVVRFQGHVGRCLITSRDPDSGVIDVPTLDILGWYRGSHEDTTEPLAFGIYGDVVEPGPVRVGDPVTQLDDA